MDSDMLEILAEAIVGGDPPDAIRRQEKRGQSILELNDTLPKRYNVGQREHLERAGVVFGDNVDDLFVKARLPEGWQKVATDHPLWTNLVDEQGRVRATIFYKAAFYDRDAFTNVKCRFSATYEPISGWGDPNYQESGWQGVVTDSDSVIWTTEEKVGPEPDGAENREAWLAWYDAKAGLANQAKAWLDEKYPDWRDPSAYWNE